MGKTLGGVVHVGLHKTATTWLQRRYFSAVGGLVNDAARPWADPIIRPLVVGNPVPPVPVAETWIISAERLSGHPAFGWCDADRIADRIAGWCPDAKIVVGIRGADEWLPSVYRQLVYAGDTRPLEVMLQQGWQRPHLDVAAVTPEALRRRYESRFNDVLLLPMELLIADPPAYVAALSAFIGVEAPSNLDFTPVNAKRDRRIEFRRRLNHFRRSELNPQPLIPATRVTTAIQARFA